MAFVLPSWFGLVFENYESRFKIRYAIIKDPRCTIKNDEGLKKKNPHTVVAKTY